MYENIYDYQKNGIQRTIEYIIKTMIDRMRYFFKFASSNLIKLIIPIKKPGIKLPKWPKKSTPGKIDMKNKNTSMLTICFLFNYVFLFFLESM